MSRIQARFASLASARRKALIPYITAGDPHPSLTVPLLRALVESGADILEIGVPFSDPMADGPVIQRSGERALKHGIGLSDVLKLVVEFRKQDAATPIVLMGYANPIEAMGSASFLEKAKAADIDGVIVVDYPPEECLEFSALAKKNGIDPVFLLAPTSTEKRIEEVARTGSGYLYYVSLRGVTGASHIDLSDVAARIPKIRAATRLSTARPSRKPSMGALSAGTTSSAARGRASMRCATPTGASRSAPRCFPSTRSSSRTRAATPRGWARRRSRPPRATRWW